MGGRPLSSKKRKKHVKEDFHYVPTAHEPERYNRCTNFTLPVGDVARRFEAMAAITKLLYLLGRPGPGTGTPVWMTDATCMQILWSKGTSRSVRAQFQLHTTTGRICGGGTSPRGAFLMHAGPRSEGHGRRSHSGRNREDGNYLRD
jgi:hypothetical protein